MMVKKTKEQKLYLLKLKTEVSEYLINYKKRYQLFPWNKVNKISKLQMNSTTPIKVNGTDFTVKKLVKEISGTKSKIQSRMKPSYYNYILKAYIKDSMNKEGKQLKEVYNQYKEELQGVFKEMKLDLIFCLEGLRQMNKTLKSQKKDSVIKESVKEDNSELESLCKKIVNESYTFIKNFLNNKDIKEKYKKWYESDDVDPQDMDKSLNYYDIDCGISQDASISSDIFDTLLKELNSFLDKKYHDEIQKYKIAWDDKNSGYIWLTIGNEEAEVVLKESVISESSNRDVVLTKALKILKDNGRNPKVTPKDKEKWIHWVQTPHFGNSLCIAGLGNDGLDSVCTKVNAEIKSYGGHLKPDNYGTAFLTIKESEDYNMFNIEDFDGKYTQEQVTQFLISCYESEIADNDEELMTEGANLEVRSIFKKFKKTYKEELKSIKANMKDNKYGEAKKSAENLLSLLAKVKRELLAIDSPAISVVTGLFTAWTVDFLKHFLICLIPYIGSMVVSIKGMIEAWAKPVKKIMDHEELSADDFNIYKNTVESRINSMEQVVKNMIKKIDQASADYKDGKNVNESVDMTFVNESGETEDVRDFVLSLYESMDDFDDVVTEGTNLDVRASLKKFKKIYKDEMRKIKVSIKDEKYDDAKKGCQKLLDVLKDTQKEIILTDSSVGSVILSFFTTWTLSFLRTFALCLIPAFGAIIAQVMDLIEHWSKPVKKALDGEGLELDDFNIYKNTVESRIDSMEKVIKNTIKKIESLKKEQAKAEKEVKESTEFNTEKIAIYEACSKGEITVEEREELLQNLKDRLYLSEAYTDDEVLLEEEGLSKKEKFEKVRSVLYERCSKGELTVEQRESLIIKAKEMIFTEEASTDKGVDVDKVSEEVMKDFGKEEKASDSDEE